MGKKTSGRGCIVCHMEKKEKTPKINKSNHTVGVDHGIGMNLGFGFYVMLKKRA